MNSPSLKSITVRDFQLMKDGSPVFYAESFQIRNRLLVPGMLGSKQIDEDTATITKYAGNGYEMPMAIESISINGLPFHFWIDSITNVWCASMTTNTGQKLIDINETCWYPDIKAMGSGVNAALLFTTKKYIGLISRGKATGGSSTHLLDTARDFTAGEFAAENNHGALAAGDRVYNITQNKLFTIHAAGIAATDLTVDAVDGGTFAANDYYCIVNPDWATLSDDNYEYGRQITEFDGDFYILDGDAIAKVTAGFVYTVALKVLDADWIALTGASNGDTIAIAANSNSLGKIFLWDKNSYGWNKKILWENTIDSIINYGNGYIFFSNNSLYFTDGYSTQKLSAMPDTNARNNINVKPKAMIMYDGRILINTSGYIGRARGGIYMYNIQNADWAYSPFDPGVTVGLGKTSRSSGAGCIFFDSLWNRIYYSFQTGGYGWTNNDVLAIIAPEEGQVQSCVIFQPIRLGKNASVKKIEVNLLVNFKEREVYDQTITLDCKLSDATKHLWAYAQNKIDEIDTAKITVDGTGGGYNAASVGDEVFAECGWNGFLRRAIASITGEGTATEVWNLDVALPNLMKQYTQIVTAPFRRYGMTPKSIAITPLTSQLGIQEFRPNFIGDNVMVELYMLASSSNFIPAIESVKIYYE